MAETVIMPRQGQSVESCIFSEWLIHKGDEVHKGDMLFAYETDKAAFEQEALADGILLDTFVEEGEEVPVLSVIAVIGEKGEDISHLTAAGAATAEPNVPNAETSKENQQAVGRESTEKEEAGVTPRKISPRAKNTAQKSQIAWDGLTGSGPEGRIIERDIIEEQKKQPKATPLAKSIAAHDHVHLPEKGSGVRGKVLAADVRQMPSVTLDDQYHDQKLSNIRKIIANNMYESLVNTAQLTLHTTADARQLLASRQLVKANMADGYQYNITINDMVCFAVVQALKETPEMNVHFMGDFIRTFQHVHLGFAVDTPRGLMVPTVQSADLLSLEGMSAMLKERAVQCQQGNIDPETLKGGTFTVTNLGGMGVEMFTPVLNPPQAGILGVNTITQRPAQLEGGVFGFVPRIGLSLTFDHRALDGAPAAGFLQRIVSKIEQISI